MSSGGKPGIVFRGKLTAVGPDDVIFEVSPDDRDEVKEYFEVGKEYVVHATPVANDDK